MTPSIILKWLIETYGCEVIAFSADLGQGGGTVGSRGQGTGNGASKVRIEDLKEEFVRDFVFPAFRADALYEGEYLLGTSIARPLIAKKQIEIAAAEGADAVSHGATGKGNDQVRFELTYMALNPDMKIVAPWREWSLKSRTALVEFARKTRDSCSRNQEKPYSCDRNLLHSSYEGGILEDPWLEPDPAMFTLTRDPADAPGQTGIRRDRFPAWRPGGCKRTAAQPCKPAGKLERVGR